ncbi:hypothetical protein Ddye_006359 [Dipteronia dyeriana]|uniref:Uncharacterized protein n=1 Tax=Dipteronia dyeriana TaxID=168575 RepID=A0AAD9XIE9_9ROSI|nr:hypothetical protein Ddye_006359 [Dipteronia dyeriana]
MASSSQSVEANFDYPTAKTLAIYKGKIVNDINGGAILKSIVCMLNELNGLEILDAPKLANQTAHVFAKYGFEEDADLFWMEETLMCVDRFVKADMPS